MTKILTHRERMENCIADAPLDRPPVALWRHFPVDDQTPEGLAGAVISFQRTFDFDFVKVTPSSSYCLHDWGVRDEWRGSAEGIREYTKRVIDKPEDWANLKPLDPNKGWLGGQLSSLREIVAELEEDVPVIQTIFNPLAQAKNLAGEERMLVHLRRNPDALHAGLKIICESTRRFIEAALRTGIAGIFFAVQHAQYGFLSEQEYQAFGTPYDLLVFEPAASCWLNVLHLHGADVMFHLFLDYPATIYNWHDQETAPDLAEAQKMVKGAVCGGLRQWKTMALGTPDDVVEEAKTALKATKGRRFVLGTGCVTPIIAPHSNLVAAHRSVEERS